MPGQISYKSLIKNDRDSSLTMGFTMDAPQSTVTSSNFDLDNKNLCDVKVACFWKQGMDCITQDLEKERRMEEEKKGKHLEPCLEQWWHCTPLVNSLDGMAGHEMKVAEWHVASLLAVKWNR